MRGIIRAIRVTGKAQRRHSKHLDEAGATMVEFALASIFLLFLLGAFFDIGLGLHNWMLLRHATSEATREIAVRYTTRPHCDAIETFLREKATPRIRKELGVDVKEGQTKWCIQWTPSTTASAGQFPILRVKSEIPGDCYFLCSFFPKEFTLAATHEAVIELVNNKNPLGCSQSWPGGKNKEYCFNE